MSSPINGAHYSQFILLFSKLFQHNLQRPTPQSRRESELARGVYLALSPGPLSAFQRCKQKNERGPAWYLMSHDRIQRVTSGRHYLEIAHSISVMAQAGKMLATEIPRDINTSHRSIEGAPI